MACSVLITGGAGFIGSHLADNLLQHGHRVRALDCLLPQVHGDIADRPPYLHKDVEFIKGDVRDAGTLKMALDGIDAVFHFAAMVGVGQSMYEIERYTAVNNVGTAVLMEALSHAGKVRKLIVASSMSVYGEGLYRDSDGRIHQGGLRSTAQLKEGKWELLDDRREPLIPLPTTEEKVPSLQSVYALSKFDQERMAMIAGSAYGIQVTGLRFFNVYGTRQALSNPYTGVLAIFASRLLNNNRPRIFEDGYQKRDFVSVHDVAQACRLALEAELEGPRVFNIGSGTSRSILEVFKPLARLMKREQIQPEITHTYRAGDIRHCFADITAARKFLGYEPRVEFEKGLVELVDWLRGQIAIDRVPAAHAELAVRGLTT